MQDDRTKANLNYQGTIYGNQYPPPPPPPYAPYSSQPIGGAGYVAPNAPYYGQTPLYPAQQSAVIVPSYRSVSMNHMLTTITPNLRAFFIISGIIYTIWSPAIISLEVVIVVKSYWTFYRGVWISGFFLSGGICMLIAACRRSYSMVSLIRVFTLVLCFCLVGIILSSINYATSKKCPSWYSSKYLCDQELVHTLKVISLSVIIVTTIHTLINIIVFNNIHKKTLKSAVPNVSNH